MTSNSIQVPCMAGNTAMNQKEQKTYQQLGVYVADKIDDHIEMRYHW